LLLYSCIFTL